MVHNMDVAKYDIKSLYGYNSNCIYAASFHHFAIIFIRQ